MEVNYSILNPEIFQLNILEGQQGFKKKFLLSRSVTASQRMYVCKSFFAWGCCYSGSQSTGTPRRAWIP